MRFVAAGTKLERTLGNAVVTASIVQRNLIEGTAHGYAANTIITLERSLPDISISGHSGNIKITGTISMPTYWTSSYD